MLARRIVPCLDVKDGRVVKGVNFVGLRDAGDPVDVARHYNSEGADELVLLDIDSSLENRKVILELVLAVSREIFIPLTVGGGISSLADIYSLLRSGSDKVSLNSAALKNPGLIDEASREFGSQCVVVAIDAKRDEHGEGTVFLNGGRVNSGRKMLDWVKEVQDRGAGEILLTSIDTDGTRGGYDIPKLVSVLKLAHVPVIASGGAGSCDDVLEAFRAGVDAALVASILHDGSVTIPELKHFLGINSVPVRVLGS